LPARFAAHYISRMFAQRWKLTLSFFAASWRPLFAAALVAIIAITAVRATAKALKPGRTGEQSRTAFLRWRPQIQALDQGTDIYRTFNYPNPPIMALILKPLTQLPPIAGMLTWFAVKALMALLMAAMVFRLIEADGTTIPDWTKALAITLSLHPIIGDLTHGNVNLFIAFLIAAALDCYRRQRDFAAGLLVALAIACKITPALFVPYFIWKRAWKTLLGIGVGLCLWWAIVPGAVLGFDYNRTLIVSWFDGMVKPFLIDGQVTSEHHNQSLPGLLTRLLTDRPSFVDYAEDDGHPIAAGTNTIVNLGPHAVDVLVKTAMLAFAVAVVWLARTRQRCGLAFAAECSLIVLGMLLFSERTWKHHATTLLLPIATLLAAAVTRNSRWLWLIVATIPVVSLVPSALDSDTQDMFLVYGTYTFLYVMLALGHILILMNTIVTRKDSSNDGSFD
jgi:hypothetical protein